MRFARLRDEEGAIGILAAASIAMLVVAAALAVDLGRLAYSSREVQGDADRAAFDAARVLGDLRDPGADALVAAQAAVAGSMGVNTFGDGFYDNQVVSVQVGDIDPDTGDFVVWAAGPNPPTAVRVTNQVWVPFVFAVGGAGGRTVERISVVEVVPRAEVTIGTAVATVTSDDATVWDSVFSELGGGSIALGAVGWQGLLDADVELGVVHDELSALTGVDLTAGSPSTVLATTVTLQDYLQATATALSAEGDPSEVNAITALTTMYTAADASLDLVLGHTLSLDVGDVGRAAGMELNVMDMVRASMQAANRQQLVSLTLPVAIPRITTATISLGLIEAPQSAFGRARWNATDNAWETTARTAQVRLQLDLHLEDLLTLAGLELVDVDLSLLVDAGRGEAALTEVVCRTPEDDSWADVTTTTGAVGYHLGAYQPSDLTNPAVTIAPSDQGRLLDAKLALGGTTVLELDGATDLTVAPSSRDDTMVGPFPASTSGGSTMPALIDVLDPGNVDVTANVLGALPVTVAEIQTALHVEAATPLGTLESDYIEPVLQALGIELGQAETTLQRVDCGNRELAQ